LELPRARQAELIICDCAIERSFAWMARCRRLARDYERLPDMLAGLHLVAFVILMLRRAADLALVHNSLRSFRVSGWSVWAG
jgi:hypothetical protein